MREPSIKQFSDFLCISPSNATYKVNTLINKGYIEKVHSSDDRREYHLHITKKFWDYYAINQTYVELVMQRIRERFSAEELSQLEYMLEIISRELMMENSTKL